MLKIYGLGRGRGTTNNAGGGSGGSDDKKPEITSPAIRKTPGEIRMQKELDDLELPPGFTIFFPDKNDLMKFEVIVKPNSGYWRNGTFKFIINVPTGYPHDPPKVKCETKVFHPNIDTDGNVCLNILREDWRPILSISGLFYGVLHLFLEPNANDPLNQEAAEMLANRKAAFQMRVREWVEQYATT